MNFLGQKIKQIEIENDETGEHTDLPDLKLFTYRISQMITDEVNQYQNGISHRPIHTDTVEYKQFESYLFTQKQKLLNKYPVLEGRI